MSKTCAVVDQIGARDLAYRGDLVRLAHVAGAQHHALPDLDIPEPEEEPDAAVEGVDVAGDHGRPVRIADVGAPIPPADLGWDPRGPPARLPTVATGTTAVYAPPGRSIRSGTNRGVIPAAGRASRAVATGVWGRIPERHCHRPVWHWQHGELGHRYAQQGDGEDHLDSRSRARASVAGRAARPAKPRMYRSRKANLRPYARA